ncbi:hypothetical protein [Pseudobacillus badius]|uniref:hypothetical protein n=1 Tax=Bacillus badius TaxID=1455 RepID=UPI0007B3CDBA|nr:hypothetical protein [Bacillus badius]KZR58987.1 hypothetical protein A3781_00315 [Bacillus badius]
MEDNNIMLENHEQRIKVLELSDIDKERRINNIEKNYAHLETTILQENRDTRQFFQSTMDKQWDLIKSMGALNDKERDRQHEIKKTKLERHTELFLKVGGAGGILYLIIQAVIDFATK